MLTATYRLPAAEFDESVAEGIQSTFRNKTVEITVREVAETPQERSHRELMQSIKNIEAGVNLVEFSSIDDIKKYIHEKTGHHV